MATKTSGKEILSAPNKSGPGRSSDCPSTTLEDVERQVYEIYSSADASWAVTLMTGCSRSVNYKVQ
jgi:hypothetical protein